MTKSKTYRSVADDIIEEMFRQCKLREAGKFTHLPGEPGAKSSDILMEEVGEVSRAINEGDTANLYTELIQVAAVAAQWALHVKTDVEATTA